MWRGGAGGVPFLKDLVKKLQEYLSEDAGVVALHCMPCLAHLCIMSIGELSGQLLGILAGEYVAETALHDQRRTAHLLGLPKALL